MIPLCWVRGDVCAAPTSRPSNACKGAQITPAFREVSRVILSAEALEAPMTVTCPICRGAELQVVTVPREIQAGDRTLLAYADELLECPECGERFITRDQAMASSRSRAAALRTHEHLLTPAEIRDIRGRFGLSQADLEGLLGVGAKTVVRWERGSVRQSRAVDALLRILEYFGPAVFDCVADKRTSGPADTPTRGHAAREQRIDGEGEASPSQPRPSPPVAERRASDRAGARRRRRK